MAIVKSITNSFNIESNYWVIEEVMFIPKHDIIEITLIGFQNEQNFKDKESPQDLKRFIYNAKDFEEYVGENEIIQEKQNEFLKKVYERIEIELEESC